MNRLHRVILGNASMESVKGFRTSKRRPAHSYRGARRNLARALCFAIPQMSWPEAWRAAQQATAQSLRQAPKDIDTSKVVRTVDEDGAVGLAPKSDFEGAPEPENVFEKIGERVERFEKTASVGKSESALQSKAIDPALAFADGKSQGETGGEPIPLVEPRKPTFSALSDADLQAAVNLRAEHPTTSAAAKAAGLSRNAFENRLKKAADRKIVAVAA